VTVVKEERAEYAVETHVALLVLEFVKVVVHGVRYLELLRHVYPLFPPRPRVYWWYSVGHFKEYFWLVVVLIGRGEKWSNHTVYNVNYHFVWCPKYRTAILEPIEASLEASFRDVCDEYDYEILSLHISPDHVHLYVSAHPKYGQSVIVRTVKSITAREMWEQDGSFLEESMWGGGFWEESYYVGTADDVSTDTIEQ